MRNCLRKLGHLFHAERIRAEIAVAGFSETDVIEGLMRAFQRFCRRQTAQFGHHSDEAHGRHVGDERIRYAGSPLKYSISEETHRKGWLIVELDEAGNATVEKRELKPLRDMRRVAASIEEIEEAMDRDKFMEADEAKEFGLIDEVFDKRPDTGEDAGTGAGDVTPA